MPAWIFTAALLATFSLQAADPSLPAESEMSKRSASPIGDAGDAAGIRPSGYRLESVTADAFENAGLPKGVERGHKFNSVAMEGGGKGDCTVAKTLLPDFKMLGGWFYISPDSTIQRIGIQIQESGGEYFLLTFPGDFTGWKWLEGSRADIVPMLPSEKSGFDGVFDQPVTRVSVVWFVKDTNPSSVGVAGLMQTEE